MKWWNGEKSNWKSIEKWPARKTVKRWNGEKSNWKSIEKGPAKKTVKRWNGEIFRLKRTCKKKRWNGEFVQAILSQLVFLSIFVLIFVIVRLFVEVFVQGFKASNFFTAVLSLPKTNQFFTVSPFHRFSRGPPIDFQLNFSPFHCFSGRSSNRFSINSCSNLTYCVLQLSFQCSLTRFLFTGIALGESGKTKDATVPLSSNTISLFHTWCSYYRLTPLGLRFLQL